MASGFHPTKGLTQMHGESVVNVTHTATYIQDIPLMTVAYITSSVYRISALIAGLI